MNKIKKIGLFIGLIILSVLAFVLINVLYPLKGLVGTIRNCVFFFYVSIEAIGVIYIYHELKENEIFYEKAKINQNLVGAELLIIISLGFEFSLWRLFILEYLVIQFIIYIGIIFILFVLMRFTKVFNKIRQLTSQFYVFEYKKSWGFKIDLHEDATPVFFSIFLLLLLGSGFLSPELFSFEGFFYLILIEIIILPFQIHWLTMTTRFELDQPANELRIIKTSWIRRLLFRTHQWDFKYSEIEKIDYKDIKISIHLNGEISKSIQFPHTKLSKENRYLLKKKLDEISNLIKK